MAQETIKCPKCGAEFKISEAISQEYESSVKAKYEKEIEIRLKEERSTLEAKAKTDADDRIKKGLAALNSQLTEKDRRIESLAKQEAEFKEKETQHARKEADLNRMLDKKEEEFLARLRDERAKIENATEKKVKEQLDLELVDLKNQVEEKSKRLDLAKQQELELRKKQRSLDEKEQSMELEFIKRIQEEKRQLAEKITRESDESHKLKDAEKDKQLGDMKMQIEELKRKAEQGSQKTQGEVLEIELEKLLRQEFQFDAFEPVASGVKGGDILQTVKTQGGRDCGKILWETKRTKNWSDAWIQKLKDDQRDSKADVAVIVSEILPKGFHHFRQIDTVWVADIPSAISLAIALRTVLIQVARTKDVQTGKEEKMEIVYNYLTGPEFRNRVQAIMESFISLKRDLDSEKRAMENIWAKREKQIDRVVTNIAGMRGDLEGIAGPALPSIKLLELGADSEK
jgi:hypothetical protein